MIHEYDGNWRRVSSGGAVEYDWCWRCDVRPIFLVPDPLVGDALGLCLGCARARRNLR